VSQAAHGCNVPVTAHAEVEHPHAVLAQPISDLVGVRQCHY
jgi:hypothetical protein